MKLYLAGPDVFRQDALAWAEEARRLCRQAGHEAIIPLDGNETTAAAIYQANVTLLRSADAVIANLNPFRGAEPDSGTCVEVGMALAMAKPVIGYIDRLESIPDRVARLQATPLEAVGHRLADKEGVLVENFGLPLNLMLSVPVEIVTGGLSEALAKLTDCEI